MTPKPEEVAELIEDAGGEVTSMTVLPDGHGFATATFPLPKDHWCYGPVDTITGFEPPPMPFRCGEGDVRESIVEKIRAAGRYAYRVSTMNGKEPDLDPDALIQNLVIGLIGLHTEDGLTSMREDADWADPDPLPPRCDAAWDMMDAISEGDET